MLLRLRGECRDGRVPGMAFSPLAMAQSNVSSYSGGIILAQAEPMQGQKANPPGDNYEAPDTMPSYQKNDGTNKD